MDCLVFSDILIVYDRLEISAPGSRRCQMGCHFRSHSDTLAGWEIQLFPKSLQFSYALSRTLSLARWTKSQ